MGFPRKLTWRVLIISLVIALPVLTLGYVHKSDRATYFAGDRPGQIALTFNTLWSSRGLPEILEILNQKEVKATFFISGAWLKLNPEAAREILLGGHEIGNRSVSSTPLLYLDENSLSREIGGFNRLSREQLEYQPCLFRPPRGEYSGLVQKVAREENCSLVLWTVESYDWLSEDCSALSRQVLDKARGGAIISFRVGSPSLTGALPEIIASLQKQGYELVTVSRLLF